jgi:PIN domain nuclease of toxin-antitoxin system
MLHSLDINDIRISPVVILELEYLYEIGRVRENSSIVIDYLSNKLDLEIDDCSFSDVIKFSVRESWTRDPFDRIIVAHARSKDAFLISKDSNMKKYYKKIIS